MIKRRLPDILHLTGWLAKIVYQAAPFRLMMCSLHAQLANIYNFL